jgi:hypothetical protein
VSQLLTFSDALDALVDYQAATPQPQAQRFARRALRAALDELAQAHHWTYFFQHGRITTSEPQDSSTITFDYSGGAYERLVTLASGSWPSWAADGVLRISNIDYEVSHRQSDTLLQLDVQSNPGEDVAAGTSYTLFRDGYVLPSDFWTMDRPLTSEIWPEIEFVHPTEWLTRRRIVSTSANYPHIYTFMGSPNYHGAKELLLYPYPDSAFTLDFIYSRRPRAIVFESESRGKVTNSASSTTVTGTDTSFTSAMIGSLIRLSTSGSEEPTGREGANPYSVERSIVAVASSTSLTVDQAITDAHTSVRYVISDPIDIDVPLMGRALSRCAESQLGKLRRLEDRTALDAEYTKALVLAKEADCPSMAPRAVGDGPHFRTRLAHYPSAADED